jgi:hypothetical protein
MKKIFTSVTLLFALSTLQAQQSPDKPNPAKTENVIYRNASLSIRQGEDNDSVNIYPKMGVGKMWVVQYSYQAPEYPQMTDDEYYESLMFQIAPPKGNRFVLKDADLVKANTVFQKSCFCADRGYFKISKGTISGTRINSTTWKITASYTVPSKNGLSMGPLTKNFTGRFRIQSQK